MKLEIESTAEIVSIEGVPCRKWNILRVDDDLFPKDSVVFTRLMLLDPDIEINDPHIMVLDGPNPPHAADIGESLGSL